MEDSNDELLASRSQSKKRRIPGACDICKRKKSDSGEMPDNRCTNCTQFGLECTHKEVTKTLGSAKGYVESLEARLEKMDRLLSKLLPGIDVNQEVDKMDSPPSVATPEPKNLPRNDDEERSSMLTVQLNKLKLNPNQNRFFGKSSGYQLVQTALDLKLEFIGEARTTPPLMPLKRHEFWLLPPWATKNPNLEVDAHHYIFPDEDLIPSLVDSYFVQMNVFLPLLHRQTFEKAVADGVHHTDPMFAGVLLLVCAHGARYSDDPRVLAEGSESPRSAGWRWFEQVNVLRKSLYKRTTLYELQLQALYVLFAQSSETPHGIWAQIGLAVRLSQEVGAHRRRRKTSDAQPNAEEELWKRAFWVVITLDRHISSFSGRPCALQEEDFDLDLPLECDDEYWEHGFKQPPDKPSSIAFFNCYLGLIDILAYAMRLIYPIKRSRNTFGKPPLSEQQVIVELDSAMNSWMDSVPTHLKWNPNCDNTLFLRQSAALHATYYYLQICIHRPFIPSPRNACIPLAFPSLAICTNAARSCCHVLESFSKVNAPPFAYLQSTAFVSAVILLLNIWSGRRSGYAPNPKREMEDVQRCADILKASERRWASAGRFWDILMELAYAGDVSIPTKQKHAADGVAATAPRKKRTREQGTDASPSASPPVSPTDVPRSIIGSRRVSTSKTTALNQQLPQPQPQPAPALFSLPMYSDELGRLPIYGQFNFSDAIEPSTRIPFPAPLSTPSSSFSTPAMSAPPSFDSLFLSNLATPSSLAFQQSLDNYLVDPLFNMNNQMLDTNVGPTPPADQPGHLAMADFASMFASGSSLDFDGRFGAMPAMDNDTMSMWSMAPTNLELDDWNTYISSVGQITQAQQHPSGSNS
ncbi:hypothetical protein BDN70DRAFT_985124 [Pholiota conissans]|uniref:Transcription factor n=1 Tax=Pholiota conissans TaxID=109636 RepID=A0A9P6D068_9AGAR|nr:hypothetical protein BDN70DRAFT_985124 [Pholiota conissans]